MNELFNLLLWDAFFLLLFLGAFFIILVRQELKNPTRPSQEWIRENERISAIRRQRIRCFDRGGTGGKTQKAWS